MVLKIYNLLGEASMHFNLSPFRQSQVLLTAFKVSRLKNLNCCMSEASNTSVHKGVGGRGRRWAYTLKWQVKPKDDYR